MTACDWFLLMMSLVNNILLHFHFLKKHHYDITMTSHHQLISSPSDSMLMIFVFF